MSHSIRMAASLRRIPRACRSLAGGVLALVVVATPVHATGPGAGPGAGVTGCAYSLQVILDGVAMARAFGIQSQNVGDLTWSKLQADEVEEAEAVHALAGASTGVSTAQDSFDGQAACVDQAKAIRGGMGAGQILAKRQELARQRAERVHSTLRPGG